MVPCAFLLIFPTFHYILELLHEDLGPPQPLFHGGLLLLEPVHLSLVVAPVFKVLFLARFALLLPPSFSDCGLEKSELRVLPERGIPVGPSTLGHYYYVMGHQPNMVGISTHWHPCEKGKVCGKTGMTKDWCSQCIWTQVYYTDVVTFTDNIP